MLKKASVILLALEDLTFFNQDYLHSRNEIGIDLSFCFGSQPIRSQKTTIQAIKGYVSSRVVSSISKVTS